MVAPRPLPRDWGWRDPGLRPQEGSRLRGQSGSQGHTLRDNGQLWNSGKNSVLTSDVPTPLYYHGHFFILSDLRKALSKVDPKTGKILWTTQMPGRYKWRASPTGGDGKIYTMNHNGEVVVLDAKSGNILHQTKLGEDYDDNIRSSIAIAGNQLFIRTNNELFCIN